MNTNIAARAGRWSAAHWKTAVSAWIAFSVVAIALGSIAGTRMLKQADTAAGGTKKAEQILRDAGFTNQAGESVLVQSKSQTISDAGFRAVVSDVARTVKTVPVTQRVRSPLAPANSGQIAADRRSALVQFEIRGDPDKSDKKVQPVLDAVDRVQARHPGFTVAEFGRSCWSPSGLSSPPGCPCCSRSRVCSRRSGSRRLPATSSRPVMRRSR
jgi:hypothetical protein